MTRSIHWFRTVRGLFVWLILSLCLSQAAHAITDTWSPAANLTTARSDHTTTLLADGRLLVVGGESNGNGSLASAELHDPASNAWSSAGNLATARQWHTAILLPSGKVLVTGGYNGSDALASAELYDPTINTWSSAGNLASARYAHTATLLPSGKVLVAGGHTGSDALTSAELYDPASNSWSSAGNLTAARNIHTATLLPSGKVLLAGGRGIGALASAELYDPASNTWSSAGSLATARYVHTATVLPSGKVLVTGGMNNTNSGITSAELYDPANNTWSSTGSLATARYDHTATLLPSGKVLVAGGNDDGAIIAGAELYDPVSSTWSNAGSLAIARTQHTATLLSSGMVLVAGGRNSNGVLAGTELYDPESYAWSNAGSLDTRRLSHKATLLSSGKILVTGGVNNINGVLASAELYDPASDIWSSAGSLTAAHQGHTVTLLRSGKVLVAGGSGEELYDPASNTWSTTGSLSTARSSHTATLLPSGKVLVAGGAGPGPLTSAELYDPTSNTWSSAGNLTAARSGHTATLLPSGKVLVAGGLGTFLGNLASAELYDPASNTWTSAGNLVTARYSHTATLLPSGKVLVAGGYRDRALASAELYDPSSNTWSSAGNLAIARSLHTATLLPSGKVLVAGAGSLAASTELYDPVSDTWSSAGSLITPRYSHTALLLPSGEVLVAGGRGNGGDFVSAERYALSPGFAENRRPVITGINSPLASGDKLQLTGAGFTGDSEASSGGANSSATDSPLVQLRRLDNDQIVWASPAADSVRSATRYESAPLSNLQPGFYALTLFVNAIPSISQVIAVVPVHTVTPSTSGNGDITPSTPQIVKENSSTIFTLIPNTGYYADSVTGTCGGTLDGTLFTTAAIDTDCTVIANFAINTYTLTYVAGANGTISGTSPQTVDHGASGSAVTAIPSASYHFVQWSDGSTSNPRTDTNVTANLSVTASFAINTYTLTYTAGANGTISGTSPQTVNHGASGAAVSASPNMGYHFVQWSDGSTSNPRTDTNVIANLSVTANFAINTYTVTAVGNGNGTIAPPTQSVNHGDMASFTVTTSPGYTVSVSGDACTVTHTGGTTWTSNAITAPCVVTATFTATPALTITVSDNRDYARYGMLLNYVVTVANVGPGDATSVSLTNTVPVQLDIAQTTWTCIGAGNGAVCPGTGSGALTTSGIVIPANRTLIWQVTTPVLLQAIGNTIDYTVNASLGGGSTVSATDRDILVIFRDGFDVANGDGTQGIDPSPPLVTCTRADFERFDKASLWVFAIPDRPAQAQAPIETILVARDSHVAGFRVERLNLDTAPRVRLVTFAPDGSERVSAWAATTTGAQLVLAMSQTAEGDRELLLEGASVSLSIPLPASLATTLQVRAQASINESCQ